MYRRITAVLTLSLVASTGAKSLDLADVLNTIQLPGTQIDEAASTTSELFLVGGFLGGGGLSKGAVPHVSVPGLKLVSPADVTPLASVVVLGTTPDDRDVLVDVNVGQGDFIALDDLLEGDIRVVCGLTGGHLPIAGDLPVVGGLLGGYFDEFATAPAREAQHADRRPCQRRSPSRSLPAADHPD